MAVCYKTTQKPEGKFIQKRKENGLMNTNKGKGIDQI